MTAKDRLTDLENAVERSTIARINGRTYNNRKIHRHALNALHADILELIGEDVVTENNVEKYARQKPEAGLINIYQDAIKRELRQKLAEYFGSGESEPVHVHDNFCLNYGKCSE